MQYYAEVSKQIQEILQRFTPIIEPLSLDEAFLDVRGSQALFGSAAAIGRRIKAEIRQELHLVASVGVAPVKFVAKIASDLQKPDGFVAVDVDRVQEILEPSNTTQEIAGAAVRILDTRLPAEATGTGTRSAVILPGTRDVGRANVPGVGPLTAREVICRSKHKTQFAFGTIATLRTRRSFMPRPFPIHPLARRTAHREIFHPGRKGMC
jgi:hypothetical protein